MDINLENVGVKVKNYKCFGDEEQGFEQIKPINIIIGKNNSGKSAILEILNFLHDENSSENISDHSTGNKNPELFLQTNVCEFDLESEFDGHINYKRRGADVSDSIIAEEIDGAQVNWMYTHQRVIESVSFNSEIDLPSSERSKFVERFKNKLLKNPFKNRNFEYLAAERSISPQNKEGKIEINKDGKGCTNVFQQILNSEEYDSSIIEELFLDDLNSIMKVDLEFTRVLVQRRNNGKWEIFLELEDGNRIALSQMGSGLQTIILVLAIVLIMPTHRDDDISNYSFAFEELENNLHPSLQRRLFKYLRKKAVNNNSTFFITTHSNVVIDIFSSDKYAQLIHTNYDDKYAVANTVDAYSKSQNVLDDLDVRASDLLQSNGIIWVEGPSDRIYINRWIELFSDGDLREGKDYQCVFYGGKLYTHLTGKHPDPEDENEFLNILRTNRNAIFVVDSDKDNSDDNLTESKNDILEELKNSGCLTWVSKGREIENYLPNNLLKEFFNAQDIQPTQFSRIQDYLKKKKDKLELDNRKILNEKIYFAQELSVAFQNEHFEDNNTYDLKEKIEAICERIRSWN